MRTLKLELLYRNNTYLCTLKLELLYRNNTYVCTLKLELLYRNNTYVCTLKLELLYRNHIYMHTKHSVVNLAVYNELHNGHWFVGCTWMGQSSTLTEYYPLLGVLLQQPQQQVAE